MMESSVISKSDRYRCKTAISTSLSNTTKRENGSVASDLVGLGIGKRNQFSNKIGEISLTYRSLGTMSEAKL